MGKVLQSTLRAALGLTPHLRRVQQFKQDPVGTQQRLLRRLLRTAADTEWGRRYGFAQIAEAPDVTSAYQARVPLHDYDDLRSDARRIRAGAEDVTWPGRMTHFAVSSGTASEGKVIPLSQQSLTATRRFSIGAGLHYLAEQRGDPSFLFGKHLTLPGRIAEDPDFPGTVVGEVSGLVAEQAPSYFQNLLQAVPNEVAFLPDWNRKLKTIARRTAAMDVRLLVMAPTWALVLFDELLDAHERRTGRRAETVAEVWPNLQVFISGGVTLSSYRALLDKRLGKPRGRPVDFMETYGASEGFFSFQTDLDDPAMLLHLDGEVFYEFVPLDQNGADEDPQRLTIAEVETGVRYAMIVTNASGLWAYRIGDVVRFTSLFPHKIRVAGRTSEMIDRYGEAVFGEEARAAVQAACQAAGARMTDFHLAPHPKAGTEEALPSHQWLVEFEDGVAAPDADAFARVLDEHLQTVNRHYQIRREAEAFGPPEVAVLPPGTFYRWLRREKERVTGQTKVPRMSEERDVAEGVLAAGAATDA